MCGVFLAVLAGTLAGFTGRVPPETSLAAGWLVLVAGLIRPWRGLRPAAIHGLFFLLAAAHSTSRLYPSAPDHLGAAMRRPIEHMAVGGAIADDPVRLPGRRPPMFVWQFPLRVERIRREVDWQTASGTVWVRLETADPRMALRYGERLLVEGNVRRDSAPMHLGGSLALGLDDRSAFRLPGRDGGSRFMRWCLRGRVWCAGRLAAGIEDHPDAVALIRALVLGYRHELPGAARDAFARTGTMHIVAISGAHVAMVAGLFLSVIRMFGVSQPRWPFFMAPMLLLYACSTGMAPSSLRACLMAICFFAAPAVWRQPDSLSALALSAVLLLAFNPAQLASPGFLLSYTVVAALILLYPPLRDRLSRAITGPGPDAAPSAPARLGRVLKRRLVETVSVTTVAWAVSTPMIAFWFNLFSPIALGANLFVVPLAFLILFASSLSLGLGWIHPVALEIYNRAAALFCDALFAVIGWHGAIPGGFARVEAPPLAVVVLAPITLVLLALGTRRVRRAGWALAVLLCLVQGLSWSARRDQRFAIRHLGPGAVMHLRAPGGGDWLFDTGPAFTAGALEKFLAQRGVDRLRGVVLTRASMEAGGALSTLVERGWVVDEVWIPDSRARSRPFAEMIRQVAARGIPVHRRGAQLETGVAAGAMRLNVLHPDPGVAHPNAMAGGLVLHVSRGPASLLILPGFDPDLRAALLRARADFGSRIVVELGVSPRGGAEESEEWLERLRPDWLIRPAARADRFRDQTERRAAGPHTARVCVVHPDERLIVRDGPDGFAPVLAESRPGVDPLESER